MRLTKYDHACVVLEQAGKKLVIDPGAFTQSFGDTNNIVGVVITHQHADHLEPRHVSAITAANPNVQFFTPGDVADKLRGANVNIVTDGDSADVGPFKLEFFGQQHAEIHTGYFQVPQNVGVLVNETVYYPGDSFTLPNVPVQVLLAPVSAPWLKIGETIDFVDAIQPKTCIPTHNALLSEVATTLTEQWLRGVCDKHGITYTHLNAGDCIEV